MVKWKSSYETQIYACWGLFLLNHPWVVHKWRHGLRRRCEGFFDDITKALVLKSVTIGGGIKSCYELRDVIYE